YPYVFYDFWHEAKRLISHSKLYNADTTLLDVGTKLFITHGGKNIKYPQGIFIDIFVLEDIPDDEHEFSRMMRRASLLRRISRFLYRMSEENYCTAYTVWKRPFKYTAFCILKLMNRCGIRLPSYKKFFHKFVDVISSYNNPESIRIANLTFVNDDFLGGERVIQKRAHYKDTAYLPFEMLTLPVPACYEDALNQLYGKDWHVFKITHNHGTFFDTERPYTYYLEEGHHFEFREFNAHL
ncbi:MAG: LicD family protein, partial [Synergistaceae bacterium]|nr:LicD family protein [Synergistaceae bacterium]